MFTPDLPGGKISKCRNIHLRAIVFKCLFYAYNLHDYSFNQHSIKHLLCSRHSPKCCGEQVSCRHKIIGQSGRLSSWWLPFQEISLTAHGHSLMTTHV